MPARQRDLIYVTVAIEPVEDTEMYLRQTVMSLEDKETREQVASVDTTAGLGGDMILLEWHGRVRMSHILRQWVKSFDDTGARRLPVTGPPDTNGDPAPEPPKGNLAKEVEEKLGREGD
jgi:hypothetical protein